MKNNKLPISYWIELILLTPFWFLSISDTKKSWREFKSGLIKHVCEFDNHVIKTTGKII